MIVRDTEGLRVSYSVIRMIWCVSFYVIDFVVITLGCVRPVIQIVTITLPIHYCILSTAYAITIYNVKISNESYRILEIYLYYSNYPIVFCVRYGV